MNGPVPVFLPDDIDDDTLDSLIEQRPDLEHILRAQRKVQLRAQQMPYVMNRINDEYENDEQEDIGLVENDDDDITRPLSDFDDGRTTEFVDPSLVVEPEELFNNGYMPQRSGRHKQERLNDTRREVGDRESSWFGSGTYVMGMFRSHYLLQPHRGVTESMEALTKSVSDLSRNMYEEHRKTSGTPDNTQGLSLEFAAFRTFVMQSLTMLQQQVNFILRNFKERLKVDLKVPDIKRCHRMGRATLKPRPILFKLHNVALRDSIWFGKTGLKGSGITISEFLTKTRHNVFMAARDARREPVLDEERLTSRPTPRIVHLVVLIRELCSLVVPQQPRR
uniref:SFRICE_038682 n=1 Tax=Spodoptera frugiperda TaxID=7108 RepID=A0A2H1W9F9_SPOFR